MSSFMVFKVAAIPLVLGEDRWDESLNACNIEQTLIKSNSTINIEVLPKDCYDFCEDETYKYSLENPKDYTNQPFCCEYSKVYNEAVGRSSAYTEYSCKSYIGNQRHDRYTSSCRSMAATDSQGNDCSWYASNPRECGNYDVRDLFNDNYHCCECGGGTITG